MAPAYSSPKKINSKKNQGGFLVAAQPHRTPLVFGPDRLRWHHLPGGKMEVELGSRKFEPQLLNLSPPLLGAQVGVK